MRCSQAGAHAPTVSSGVPEQAERADALHASLRRFAARLRQVTPSPWLRSRTHFDPAFELSHGSTKGYTILTALTPSDDYKGG